MSHAVSIRRAILQDVEALVSVRLELARESGHMKQEQVFSDLQQATYQYFVEFWRANLQRLLVHLSREELTQLRVALPILRHMSEVEP